MNTLSPVRPPFQQTQDLKHNRTSSQKSNDSFQSTSANRKRYKSIDRSEVSSMRLSMENAYEDKAWLRYIQAVDEIIKMLSHKVMYLESKLVL